tara:strand:- start:3461 stop:4354 length:894 start_codon:yes stop_codon:yes gene_type:complete
MKLLKIEDAIRDLETVGYYKTSVFDVLEEEEINDFFENVEFFQKMSKDQKIRKEVGLIENNPAKRFMLTGGKPFEITHTQFLNGPLTLNNSKFIKIYTSNFFEQVASKFLQVKNPKIFNVLAWIHYWKEEYGRLHSQNWHRDREDYKILKCFIYYSDVSDKDGPFEYVPRSFCGGDFHGLYKGRTGYWDYTPDPKENTGLPKTQEEVNMCDSTFVSLTGKVGDIILANNTGFHRGGFVRNGARACSHALFLRPDAYMIEEQEYFTDFNYASDTVNYVDFKSQEFKNLGDKRKLFKVK